MQVQVDDGRFSANTTLLIRIEDVNDNAPEISGPSEVQVSEDAERGTEVARLRYSDKDAGDTAL